MKMKNYLIGFYVLFLPVLLFLDINNLRLISNKSLTIIFLSIVIFFFIILIFYKIYLFIFKLPLENNLFPGLCFVFYLQFYYTDIIEILNNNLVNAGYIVLFFLVILSIIVVFLWSRHFIILNKFALIFSILITTTFFYNFYIFSAVNTDHFKVKKNRSNKIISINEQKEFNNIYLIIFDSLMPFEDFEKNVDKNFYNNNTFKVSSALKTIDESFKYLKGSVSNYNNTKLSISSIFNNNYFMNEKSNRFKDYFSFYPYFLYQKDKINNLDYLNRLKKNRINFVWFSNTSIPCKNISGIICGTNSNVETDILNEVKIFYSKTALVPMMNKLTRKFHNDIPSNDLINYIKYNKTKNNFFFIHNMIPNGPQIYDDNCNITGKIYPYYNNSYLCSIKKIGELTKFIIKHDNDATVLITADHGVRSPFYLKENLLVDDLEIGKEYYDPRIFALAKYPQKCSSLLPKTYDLLNLSRFLLNCNYSENLDYLPYSYYRTYTEDSLNFGRLINDTNYFKEYFRKKRGNN